jgi:hypothetical protein
MGMGSTSAGVPEGVTCVVGAVLGFGGIGKGSEEEGKRAKPFHFPLPFPERLVGSTRIPQPARRMHDRKCLTIYLLYK